MYLQTVDPRFSHPSRWTRISFKRSLVTRRIRNYLDVVVCVLAFPVILPLMAIIALAVVIDSGRPIIFVQERIGYGGQHFRMFKFRSLYADHSEKSDREYMKAYINGELDRKGNGTMQSLYKPFQKNQVTRVGNILRKTSLDELPQVFNVLRGEMALVGPRPNVPWEVEAYSVWHIERLEGLPGITGLAQVRGRSGLTWDQMARYDIEYLRNQSLWLDLNIIWWTVASIFSGRGAG